ncbi:spore coat U domain-containing protein [Bordetella sp. N]|uniref:Csu type fimbrial protein n=1 Tax=Bordetella sp. N TaxID=1746199 RepID=UPI00070CBCB8|nr:spore coat U domain-containing protein [Bordetella sp. N]ALM84162.1 hypothetical protein ASB57_15325 [Bordetella sp. N]
MGRRCLLALTLLLAFFACVPAAQAQTCSAAMTPLAINSVSPVRGTSYTGSATLTVTCTWGLINLAPNAQVCVNLGTGTNSTSQNPRTLGNGSNRLQYRIAGNAGYSPLWGSTATSTTPISLVLTQPALGTTASANITINAQTLASQFTVPTVGDAATTYTESFAGVATLAYSYYLLGSPPACSTLTPQTTFTPTITASVINDCLISANTMNFGTTGLITAERRTTSLLTVQCTNNASYRIALNGGSNGTVTARNMLRSGGTATQVIPYQLYTDSGYSIPWGDGTAGTAMYSAIGNGLAQPVTVYGRVAPQATGPVPGTYNDTVQATIYF